MARQKQVDDCISRCLAQQPPIPGHKLSATLATGFLTLHHYHHKLLVYDLAQRKPLHEWWEKPTDRRILTAALAYLQDIAPCNEAKASLAGSLKTLTCERLTVGKMGDCNLGHGEAVEDRSSIFMAHIAFPVRSEHAAHAAIAKMRQHSRANSATHNISAFRISGLDKVDAGCDDDGEDRAGRVLLSVLEKDKVLDVAVVVSRWYGGINLGKARFRHIRESTRVLLQQCGHQPGVPMTEASREWGQGHTLGSSSDCAQSPKAKREMLAAAAELRAARSSVVAGHDRQLVPTETRSISPGIPPTKFAKVCSPEEANASTAHDTLASPVQPWKLAQIGIVIDLDE